LSNTTVFETRVYLWCYGGKYSTFPKLTPEY
jgi:hypothetical protein